MSEFDLTTPVLFLTFNRPDTTIQVFEAIRQAKPKQLFVAADGPRADRSGEEEKCEEVRQIATKVDWDCEIKTLFREKNLGCRIAVSSAIDWFFENVEEGIILEDDCLPHPTFFCFASELLKYYRDDKRIMCISAQHFHRDAHKTEHSYFFSRYNHCWAWASWRRAWSYYDYEMSQWPALRATDWLLSIGDGSKSFQNYWKRIFNTAYAGKIDSWAYRWTLSCWAQSGLTILPTVNLVRNIGFDCRATHCTKGNDIISNSPLQEIRFPLNHPPTMVRDVEADVWEDRNVFRITAVINMMQRIYATQVCKSLIASPVWKLLVASKRLLRNLNR